MWGASRRVPRAGQDPSHCTHGCNRSSTPTSSCFGCRSDPLPHFCWRGELALSVAWRGVEQRTIYNVKRGWHTLMRVQAPSPESGQLARQERGRSLSRTQQLGTQNGTDFSPLCTAKGESCLLACLSLLSLPPSARSLCVAGWARPPQHLGHSIPDQLRSAHTWTAIHRQAPRGGGAGCSGRTGGTAQRAWAPRQRRLLSQTAW